MILQSYVIGGWEKLELWHHTHLALLALLVMVCVLEVILLKITISARLFTRPHHYDSEYEDSGEYEEDIYYEELTSEYNQWAGRQIHLRHRQQPNESLIMQQQQTQHPYNNFNQANDEDNQHNNNYYHLTSTDLFRFVY